MYVKNKAGLKGLGAGAHNRGKRNSTESKDDASGRGRGAVRDAKTAADPTNKPDTPAPKSNKTPPPACGNPDKS